MNHECESCGSLLYSAVPVLPYTAPPGVPLHGVAVPDVTTARIIVFIDATVAGFSAAPGPGLPVTGGSETTVGAIQCPRATAPTALIKATGLTSVLPCPNAAAAWSTAAPSDGTDPVNVFTPTDHLPPMPSCAAVFRNPSGPSFGASDANAVLHDFAKSVSSGTAPNSSPPSLPNARPSTTSCFGQFTTDDVVSFPDSSTFVAVTVLNVDPGGT